MCQCECERDTRQSFPRTIIVDGVEKRVVWPKSSMHTFLNPGHTFDSNSGAWYTFNLDSPDCPGVPCSEHSLRGTALAHMLKGYWVFTSGSKYEAPAKKV